jgi:hypothetical protein
MRSRTGTGTWTTSKTSRRASACRGRGGYARTSSKRRSSPSSRRGARAAPTKRPLTKTGVKDLERGLSLALPIENYTSSKETKDFIRRQATKLAADVKEKSGVWYRLNRWREEQVARGARPTYGDLVHRYVALNSVERFEKIPHGRWINFRAAFLAAEAGATHDDARAAWARLKKMDAPKTYAAWVAARRTRR